MFPVDAQKPVCFANFNKIVYTVNSNKREHPVSPSTLVCPADSSKFVHSVNVCTVNSNKPLHPVNSSKPCVCQCS